MLELLVALFWGSPSIQTMSGLNPAYGVVLPEPAGAPLRRPRLCNRPMPWPIEGTWVPDAAVITRLEARLAPALQTALDAAPQGRYPKPEVSKFYRQYLGFIVSSRRMVYINAAYEQIVRGGRPEEWKTVAWNGCDGGLSVFGAEYDPATDTVSNVIFNGGGRGGAAVAPVSSGQSTAASLPEALQAHVKNDRFDAVTSIRGFPLGVRSGLQSLFGTFELDIAEPGARFQETRATVTQSLPIRRLIAGGCSTDHCLVHYERGGTAHTWHVAVFHWTPAATRFEWGGSAPGKLATIDDIRKAILSGVIKSSKDW